MTLACVCVCLRAREREREGEVPVTAITAVFESVLARPLCARARMR
jgi:hypothetical protein